MKKYLLVALVVSCFVFGSKDANAGVYFFGNGGGGGKADGGSIGGEIGGIWPKDAPKYLLGLGLSQTNSEKSEPATFILDKVRSNEYEFYGAAGLGLTKGFFITGTGGVTETCEGTVLKGDDPSSCADYDGNDVKYKFTGSGQLRFVHKQLMLGIGYHSRRGIIGGIGISF